MRALPHSPCSTTSCPRGPLWTALLVLVLAAAGCDHGAQGRLRDPTAAEVAQLRYQMAESLVARKEYQAAAQYIRDQLRQAPNDARLHLLLGVVLREKGVYSAAEREIRHSMALQPDVADSHAALGVLLAKRRLFDAAEKEHRRATELAPKVAAYHNDLGFCLMMQKRFEEAKSELEEAIRLDPTLRRAFNNLGMTLGLMDEESAAMAAFSQAGSRAMALTNMGYVYELQGRRAQARLYYEKALRAHRGYGPAMSNLRRLDPSRYEHTPAEGSEPIEEVTDERTEGKTEPTEGGQAEQQAADQGSQSDAAAGGGGGAAQPGGGRLLQGATPGRQDD